jgi:hypothetical protein
MMETCDLRISVLHVGVSLLKLFYVVGHGLCGGVVCVLALYNAFPVTQPAGVPQHGPS